MVFRRYCIQNVKDGIQFQVYNIINESVNHSSQFISVKVKKNLRKSQPQFGEKLRKLRLRQNNDFLIKKTCNYRWGRGKVRHPHFLGKLFINGHIFSTMSLMFNKIAMIAVD